MTSPGKVMYRVTIQAWKLFISLGMVLNELNFGQTDKSCGPISLQALTPSKGQLSLDDSLV